VKHPWPKVCLRDALEPVAREEPVDPLGEYRLLGVRLDGDGPFLRETVTGSETSASKLFRVASGDFIYSRLFASRGAFGVVDPELDGCYVSAEFPTFVPIKGAIDVRFLRHWFRLPETVARVSEGCSGSTPLTRNRFKEPVFLKLEIPLPHLAEQRRVVSRIDEIESQVRDAQRLGLQQQHDARLLLGAAFRRAIVGAPWRPMGEVALNHPGFPGDSFS
jgi:type I restriction enzyme S subunit